MARLIIFDDFSSQVELLSNIVAQNTTLGATSPLSAFLTQQGIVLTADVAAGASAQTHETNRTLLSKQSENYRQLRDNSFAGPWQTLTGCAQFLKSFYKGNTKQLGNWGLTITDGGKINYPRAFADRVTVFTAFAQKAHSFGTGANPLQPYLTQHNVDLTQQNTLVQQAVANNKSFSDTAQQSENETQLRNQIWLPVLAHIKTIGSYLMKLYANNSKALGNWGFSVGESTRKPKLRTSKIKPGKTSVFNGLTIGGTLTNIGAGEIHLYRGKTTTGAPAVIHAGEQFGIVKGYSTVTVVNPSTLTEAKFTALTAA